SSETALAISGAARLTAQGSGAAGLGVGAALVGAACADVVAACVRVGSGVLETVESPDPQPTRVTIAAATRTACFTTAHRTVTRPRRPAGARRKHPPVGTRLQVR